MTGEVWGGLSLPHKTLLNCCYEMVHSERDFPENVSNVCTYIFQTLYVG